MSPNTIPPDPVPSSTAVAEGSALPAPAWSTLRSIWRAVRFLGLRAILIAATIFIGIFLTIVMINRPVDMGLRTIPPQLESTLMSQINLYVRAYKSQHPAYFTMTEAEQDKFDEVYTRVLVEEQGLNLPYLQRHLRWTWKALQFDWGQLRNITSMAFGRVQNTRSLNEVVLQYMGNTLLLAGTANLLIFLLGIPFALFLARRYGSWLDRLMTVLSPISSIPSWVIGLILVAIFAVELRLLPVGGMYDTVPSKNTLDQVLIVAKHMVLPVASIFLSLFFQLVYSWRTFFVIFSEEDYVDLGKAVGLPKRQLERKYILKPTLSYVITSFSLMLVSFWQMMLALEVVFNWPGIGWLYINVGLPNFWGESMYPGELRVALTLVVAFAYLLGVVAFLLDIIYILVDPRIHLSQGQPTLRLKHIRLKRRSHAPRRSTAPVRELRPPTPAAPRRASIRVDLRYRLQSLAAWMRRALREVRRYPTAVVGLVIILFLVAGSLYAVLGMPYEKIGGEWGRTNLTGRPTVPKLAKPTWVNLFRANDYLSTLRMDSRQMPEVRSEHALSDGMRQVTFTFTFDYPYLDFPSEMYLYLDSTYVQKKPFASLVWTTPDGREIKMQGISIIPYTQYNFDTQLRYKRMVNANPNWQAWWVFGEVYPTPVHHALFADPEADKPRVVNGTYTLRVEGITFEEGSDIQAELILLGQVYGLAGTDIFRRDLLVPLLWGMPFALGFGLAGAVSTTLLSMILAAAGVWFGGWVDNLVQRLTEMNLVLPVLAICVLAYAYLHINLWVIMGIIVLLNVFGTPTKNFRSAFLQIRNDPYIEAAQSYGATNWRIIRKYMVPRIVPVLTPQIVLLIPGFIFLEATLGLFNISTGYPTWGTIIYQAATRGALYGSRFWVMEPLAMLLLTGLGFSMFGIALERILNPRLLDD